MESSHEPVRLEAMRWAAEAAADPRTVYLDTETTGLGRRAEIVDIGIVDSQGRVLMDRLVRPEDPIPAEASAIHGLYGHHVSHAPRWPDIADEVASILSGRRVIVYNARYDRGIVEGCCERHSLAVVGGDADWQCAMLEYAKYRGEPNTRGRSFRWHKLDVAVQEFGAPAGGHRALTDALACRVVVVGMANGQIGSVEPALNAVSDLRETSWLRRLLGR